MTNDELYYRLAESKSRDIENSADMLAVENAQAAYRECVEACIQIFKKRGITCLTKNDVSKLGFASEIESTLYDAVRIEFKNLADDGVDVDIRGDDVNDFFAAQYAILKAKPATSPAIMFAEELKSSRVITNPQTMEDLERRN